MNEHTDHRANNNTIITMRSRLRKTASSILVETTKINTDGKVKEQPQHQHSSHNLALPPYATTSIVALLCVAGLTLQILGVIHPLTPSSVGRLSNVPLEILLTQQEKNGLLPLPPILLPLQEESMTDSFKLEIEAPDVQSQALDEAGTAYDAPPLVELSQNKSRALICITGQMRRLELENKVQNLFKPLQDAGYETDLALVLTRGRAQFTNLRIRQDRFITEKSVNDFLADYPEINLLNPPEFMYDRLENPNVPAIYYMMLKTKTGREWRTYEEELDRAQNHVRIFDAYKRCWEMVNSKTNEHERLSTENAIHSNKSTEKQQPPYDVYIRIREDVGFEQPLNATLVDSLLPPPASKAVEGDSNTNQKQTTPNRAPSKTVITTDCRPWNGINDRLALVSSTAAESFFLHPNAVLRDDPYQSLSRGGDTTLSVDWEEVRNPETLLMEVYRKSNITLIASPFLRGVNRVVRSTDVKGKFEFHEDDIEEPLCPGPDGEILWNDDKNTKKSKDSKNSKDKKNNKKLGRLVTSSTEIAERIESSLKKAASTI
jgi:hypothetical protein